MLNQLHSPQTEYYYEQPPRKRRLKQTHTSLIIWHVLVAYYYLCSSHCSAESKVTGELVDLSHVFDNTTIYWVTEKGLTLNVTYNGTVPGQKYWYQKDEISAATHGGTHLDAPCHFARGRWCVSDIPLERLVVPAAVVDISDKVNGDPNVHLTEEHLSSWEEKYGKIPDGSLLLVNTGWWKFWPDPLTYSGTMERNVSLLMFPSITPEAAKWLVSERNIVGVGIDTMSVDIPGGVPQTHVTLMEKNIYGLENVNNLHRLPPKGATVFVMPMKLKNASGAPCRMIAQISSSMASCATCAIYFPALLIVSLMTYGMFL